MGAPGQGSICMVVSPRQQILLVLVWALSQSTFGLRLRNANAEELVFAISPALSLMKENRRQLRNSGNA